MIRPAWIETLSGLNAANPRAITSALTNSVTANVPCKSSGAAVDFPAPFGPAMTMIFGLPNSIGMKVCTMLPIIKG